MSSYRLNCLVLGDDPANHIFQVDIGRTQTVGDLKELIKEEKKNAFHDIDADRLLPVKIDKPVDEALENHLNSVTLGPKQKQSLSPILQLFEVFSEQPDEEHLHIVVQPPHTVPVVPQNPLVAQRLAYLQEPVSAAPGTTLGCPYPRSYTHSNGRTQKFSYNGTQILKDRLIFFGETVGDEAGRKICIKFVRYYSREAHDFCAIKGHAPELIAYEPLAGGWNMVIMDALDISDAQQPGSYRPLREIDVSDRQPLKKAITSLIEELHNYNGGYVHGDLRDTNLFVGDNKSFMLLDFDWAGPIETARYPMNVNREGIRRPDGARDGEKILVQHDLDMLKYIFSIEEDSWERATKRRRISTGEGLNAMIHAN